MAEPQNVVLVVIDTLRADHLHCYGYPRQTSPTIDGLAQAGVRFTQAIAAWPATSQSMAAVLSGLYSSSNGVRKNPYPVSLELRMLPEMLRDLGLQTAAAVENSVLSKELNYDRGFDHYAQAWDSEVGQPTHQAAKDWLRTQRDPDRPFFLYVHLLNPHAPYTPNRPYDEMFVGDEYYDPTKTVRVWPQNMRAFGGLPGISKLGEHTELDYYIAQYDGEIRQADHRVGEILETIETLGLAENTLVILTADHGEGFGEHNYYWHGALSYDAGARVPLIFSHPRIGRGIVEQPVSLIDLTPTILDFLRAPIPQHLQGQSLGGLLADPTSRLGRRFVFGEGGNDQRPQRTVRTDSFKLIYVPTKVDRRLMGGRPLELYDLRTDPGETNNVAADYPEIRKDLVDALRSWAKSNTAPVVDPAEPLVLDDELRKRLEALGYVQ